MRIRHSDPQNCPEISTFFLYPHMQAKKNICARIDARGASYGSNDSIHFPFRFEFNLWSFPNPTTSLCLSTVPVSWLGASKMWIFLYILQRKKLYTKDVITYIIVSTGKLRCPFLAGINFDMPKYQAWKVQTWCVQALDTFYTCVTSNPFPQKNFWGVRDWIWEGG